MKNNAEIDNEDNIDEEENIIDIIFRRLNIIEEGLVMAGVGEFCPECGEYDHQIIEPNKSSEPICFIPPKKEEIN